MEKYQIWDKKSDVYTFSNKHYTADQWKEKYPWINVPGAKMIISAGLINGGCAMEFEATKNHYKTLGAAITEGMTDEQVLQAIEDWETAQSTNTTPSTEERIAAALELQNLNAMTNTPTTTATT